MMIFYVPTVFTLVISTVVEKSLWLSRWFYYGIPCCYRVQRFLHALCL